MEQTTVVNFVVQRRVLDGGEERSVPATLRDWYDLYREPVQQIAEDNVRLHNAEESGKAEYRAVREVCICIREPVADLPRPHLEV